MILSDRTIREEIDAGRIVIDPFDDECIQPSSIDLHVDSQFRVFANHRYPYIDVKQEQPDLTELVEVEAGRAVHPAPGRVRAGVDLGARRAARRPGGPARGQVLARAGSAC